MKSDLVSAQGMALRILLCSNCVLYGIHRAWGTIRVEPKFTVLHQYLPSYHTSLGNLLLPWWIATCNWIIISLADHNDSSQLSYKVCTAPKINLIWPSYHKQWCGPIHGHHGMHGINFSYIIILYTSAVGSCCFLSLILILLNSGHFEHSVLVVSSFKIFSLCLFLILN